MFSKMFTFVLMLIILTVQVQASTQDGLKAAYNELNYSISTEWDQKDQNFLNAQTEKFTSELRKLRESGLSNQEMMDFSISQIKDKNLARDIQTTFSMVSINAMSPDEAQEHMKNALNKSYGEGASWSGSAVVLTLLLTLIVVGAVLVVANQEQLKKEAESCYMAYKCNEVCGLTGCEMVCADECI